MPTDEIIHASRFPPSATDALLRHSPNAFCPPDLSRVNVRSEHVEHGRYGRDRSNVATDVVPRQQLTPAPDDDDHTSMAVMVEGNVATAKRMGCDEEHAPVDTPSPISMTSTSDIRDEDDHLNLIHSLGSPRAPDCVALQTAQYDFSKARLLPNYSSSFLRPGSKFRGTQQSERQIYEVQVELKHVDMDQSFLCGYLRIQGLTEDHPTLTTYFEGEVVGDKYSFSTRHPEWGSNDRVDMDHWAQFNAWRPLAKSAKKPDFLYKNFRQREHLFMRWKEYFLVPDHTVRSISGASFEGFYYICFNQLTGAVNGIYFHAKSEKHQQLELVHLEDRGCFGAMEFR